MKEEKKIKTSAMDQDLLLVEYFIKHYYSDQRYIEKLKLCTPKEIIKHQHSCVHMLLHLGVEIVNGHFKYKGVNILSIEKMDNLYPDRFEESEEEIGVYPNVPYERFIIIYEDFTYSASDNTDKHYWCEDFKTFEDAFNWLEI